MACKNYISCNSHKQYFSKSRFLDIQQKQPPEVLFKKGVLRNFAKFTGKHLCQSFFFNKVAGLRHRWHRCFPVNFVKFPTTLFYRTPPVAASDQDSIVKLSANNKLLVVIFTSFGVCSWSSSVLLSLFKKSVRSFISRLKRRVLSTSPCLILIFVLKDWLKGNFWSFVRCFDNL